METFAAELLESVHDLDDRKPICKPPPPTTDDNADKEITLKAVQDTQNGAGEETKLKNSTMKKRLGRLSYLRLRTDDIEFTSSQPHSHGGKAEVVKATLKRAGSTELQVAVKKLRYDDERKFCNEFVHEVDMMAQLLHRNIARLIGFVEDLEEGKAWIVMCWEPNGNVSEFLATGEWEIPERISLDTFAGIEYLHTRRPPICHGDLKSLNILVSASYRAIITDFGSARIVRKTEDRREGRDDVPGATGASAIAQATDERIDRTQITIVASNNQLTLTGPAWSLRWAAPEVALGEPQDLASDIWAAGWICWEVMTNKVPFPELNSEGAIVLKVVEGHVPVARENTQLSQIISLCSLMTDCWAFDPRNRPDFARCNREVKWMPSVSPSGRKASGPNVPSADLLYQMGSIHNSQSNFKEAIPLFEQAFSIATSAGDQRKSAAALSGLGKACYGTSNDAEAGQYFTRAQEMWTQIGDEYGQANALHWMGKVYHHQSKLTQAEASYTLARNIYSRLKSIGGEAVTSRALGNIFYERSQYTEAEEFYDQAIDIFARLGDHMGQADTLMRLGELFSTRSEYTKAEELFNQALKLYSRIGHNMGRANMLYDLGQLYRQQGLNTKAAPFLAEAGSLYALIGDSKLEGDCSYWLNVVSTQGDPSPTSLSVPGNDDVPSPAPNSDV
ncbi:hypothetical protein M407DRAFT_25786 [Tulasnella calospora MUT 4182]|uniref:Protein kinase domain-containing protein n=1 Tax=Tulasnella calospora MUT 4182 TaxID=1051891 RepID=A0A0C3Q6B0_9AGAM|nr:hypothetical protein M407DRAFT_25786 [Tulasnella calospora MUT 4182]